MKVWALLGAHQGDNNQVLALAEALGLPFERKQLNYNHWRHLQPRLLGATFRSLKRESRKAIGGEAPDLTISTGHRSVPVIQELRRRSSKNVRSIHIGYPRISPGHFDLVVATPEYPIADHPNLLRIPFALTRKRSDNPPDATFLAAYPPPRRLVILGGPTLYWRLTMKDVAQPLEQLLAAADRDGGSVLVVGSPRTPRNVLAGARVLLDRARAPTVLIPTEGPPSYGSLLACADSLFVTADSVAMVSDAIATGKPVGLIAIQPTLGGRVAMGLLGCLRSGRRMRPRDLRYFWQALGSDRLVGTVSEPRCGDAVDVERTVVKHAQALLNGGSAASP